MAPTPFSFLVDFFTTASSPSSLLCRPRLSLKSSSLTLSSFAWNLPWLPVASRIRKSLMCSAKFFTIFSRFAHFLSLCFIFWASSTLAFFQLFESAHLPHHKSLSMRLPMCLGLRLNVRYQSLVLFYLRWGWEEIGCAEFVVKHSLVGLFYSCVSRWARCCLRPFSAPSYA